MEREKADQEEWRQCHREADRRARVQQTVEEATPAVLRAHAAGAGDSFSAEAVHSGLESGVTSTYQARQSLDLMGKFDPLDLKMEREMADQEERRHRYREADRCAGVQHTVEEVKIESTPADLRAHAAGAGDSASAVAVQFGLESAVTSSHQARQFFDLLVKTRPMILDIGRHDDPAEVRLRQSVEASKLMPRSSVVARCGQRAVSAAASAAAVSSASPPQHFSTSAAGPSRADEEHWRPNLHPHWSENLRWWTHCPTMIGHMRLTDCVLNSPPEDNTFWSLICYLHQYTKQQDDYIFAGGETMASSLIRARICLGSTVPPTVESLFDAVVKDGRELRPLHILWLYALGLAC